MLGKILNFLRIDSADKVFKDGPERIKVHKKILLSKKLTQNVFQEFYKLMIKNMNFHFKESLSIKKVELGSGTSFLKEIDKSILKTDIVDNNDLDLVVDATNMPFKNNEIKSFFGIFFFHHLQNPYKFLDEIDRCCAINGGAILIEPYHGPLSRFLHQNMHDNEYYDLNGPTIKDTSLPMSNANQALSHIVFFREKKIFEKKYPNLKVVEIKRINSYLRYLVSGGVNFKQLLPDIFIPLLKLVEFIMKPFSHIFCVHYLIVIKKIK